MKKTLVSLSLTTVLMSPVLAQASVDPSDLVGPLTDYKMYVIGEVAAYVKETKSFTDAVKAGDIDRAKSLYAPARVHYERIEPVAELFSDLDASMDAREDDYARGSEDPDFSGFHRIEKGLWADHSTAGLDKYADQLYRDAVELENRLTALTFPPSDVVGGAAGLIEEVAASKISGEEDRYSRTDLSDFQANVDGAEKIVELFHPLLEQENPELVTKIDSNLASVNEILAKYRTDDGFKPYDALTRQDRLALKRPITVLAEDLSLLRGVLDLD